MWSCPSLYITRIQLISKNSVTKLLRCVLSRARSTHLNSFLHKRKKKWKEYIKISFYCSVRFLMSPVSVPVSTGADKVTTQRKKHAASVRKMDPEIQKRKKKAQYDVCLHNGVMEPGVCFRNLFLPTDGIWYLKVNKLWWKPYSCFVSLLLLSLFPGDYILAVYSFSEI